jgi:hypothetical protein
MPTLSGTRSDLESIVHFFKQYCVTGEIGKPDASENKES